MAKTVSIDFSDDRLITIASEMAENNNFIGALKMLNKNEEISGSAEDALMLYAEIYESLGLYEKSINKWFRYMDESPFSELADCYEGLAECYMNLGNDHFSAIYYNKLLMETDEIDPEARREIINEFMSSRDNPLKFAYPPELADYSDVLDSGMSYMRDGDFDRAIEKFGEVANGNPKYDTARNFIAMCKIICDRHEEAEQECMEILRRNPDDVQALTTLAAVKSEQKKREEAIAVTRKLLALDCKDSDDIYKIATVCCENGMHEEALAQFKKMSPEFLIEQNIAFFMAVSAFNCGRFDESLTYFDRLLTVYPEAVTARYYFVQAKNAIENNTREEMSYFYRLPPEMRESTLKVLSAFMKLNDASAKKLAKQVDLTTCVLWCFDECEGKGGGELQMFAAETAVKAGLDSVVREILLNAFLSDAIKVNTLRALAERNTYDIFGAVVCNMYRRVTTTPVNVGRLKRKAFVRAYAKLFSHFAIVDEEYGEKFSESAENLYNKLEQEGRLGEVKDVKTLSAGIYLLTDVRPADIDGDNIYKYFEVAKSDVLKLIGRE